MKNSKPPQNVFLNHKQQNDTSWALVLKVCIKRERKEECRTSRVGLREERASGRE